MSEAVLYKQAADVIDYTPTTAKSSGEVIELPDGRAGVVTTDLAAAQQGSAHTEGIFTMAKTASISMLKGQPLYWNATTNKVNYTGDFYVGVSLEDDIAGTATTIKVDLNVEYQPRLATFGKGHWETEDLLGVGSGMVGGAAKVEFDVTAEAAQGCVKTHDTIALTELPIFEAWVNVINGGDDAALDVNIGLANGTAADFDDVVEQVTIHLDGNSTAINAESDDDTTHVEAVDTTKTYTAGTPFFVQIDTRVIADIQIYINGVNVLPASEFKLDAATGPIFPVLFAEKASNDTLACITAEMSVRTQGTT
jgi:predicted RecA/RadA family phage recombinase